MQATKLSLNDISSLKTTVRQSHFTTTPLRMNATTVASVNKPNMGNLKKSALRPVHAASLGRPA